MTQGGSRVNTHQALVDEILCKINQSQGKHELQQTLAKFAKKMSPNPFLTEYLESSIALIIIVYWHCLLLYEHLQYVLYCKAKQQVKCLIPSACAYQLCLVVVCCVICILTLMTCSFSFKVSGPVGLTSVTIITRKRTKRVSNSIIMKLLNKDITSTPGLYPWADSIKTK